MKEYWSFVIFFFYFWLSAQAFYTRTWSGVNQHPDFVVSAAVTNDGTMTFCFNFLADRSIEFLKETLLLIARFVSLLGPWKFGLEGSLTTRSSKRWVLAFGFRNMYWKPPSIMPWTDVKKASEGRILDRMCGNSQREVCTIVRGKCVNSRGFSRLKYYTGGPINVLATETFRYKILGCRYAGAFMWITRHALKPWISERLSVGVKVIENPRSMGVGVGVNVNLKLPWQLEEFFEMETMKMEIRFSILLPLPRLQKKVDWSVNTCLSFLYTKSSPS